MASILELERSLYEAPKIDVIEFTAKDIVCLSTSNINGEGGGEFDGNWDI
ncbi:MAG: hypothetical protein IJY21_03880 [Clostridia bacterium]|nr:hypothetical protein [Clostridia bacterium]